MVKKLITPIVLVLVAALSWWYIKTLDKSLMQQSTVVTKGPDYFMYDTVSTIMDESGKLKHQLETAYLAHFSEDNRTELEDARLTLHQQDGSLWTIQANRGTLYQETEQIYLAGNVVIEKPQTDNSDATDSTQKSSEAGIKIQTDKLHIDPKLQIAQTQDPVVISNQDVRVNAVGMKANLQTKSVELLAKVKGTYVPPNK
ncbi:LPS export ABC transporter periplasmic protein LptC [Kaarinaea lacus]